MNTNNLRKWAVEKAIEQQTIEGFWVCFHSYKEGSKRQFNKHFGRDFDENQLTVEMSGISLHIDEWDCSKQYHKIVYGFDFVVSFVPIVYKNERLGDYRMLFNLDGESFDDYFVID